MSSLVNFWTIVQKPLSKKKFQGMINNNQQSRQTVQFQTIDSHYTLQRDRTLSTGAKVLEQGDMVKKRIFYQTHIERLEKMGQSAKAEILRKELKKYPELTSEEVIFQSVAISQEPSTAYALWAHSANGPYYIFPTSYAKPTEEIDATLAHGQYQFAITIEHPSEVLVGTGGHDALAKHGNVWYAGTAYFEQGQLQRWNNDTGHYRTSEEYRAQALRAPTDDLSGGLLPLRKFVAFHA